MTAIAFAPGLPLTDEQFETLCRQNPDTNFELSAKGELIVVPPLGGESGSRESQLIAQLVSWCDRDGTGLTFSSQTIFQLPSGAKRMPDVAWVRRDRWEALSPKQQQGFPPLAPDFVAELRSFRDELAPLQTKMEESVEAGVRLSWLIDPQRRVVEIYTQNGDCQELENPDSVNGDPVLPGFTLSLKPLFQTV
jgi:Uma2 family endonuclease